MLNLLVYLYKQKPFEVSPYTITGNESKVFMVSEDEAYPTVFSFIEYKVDINEGEINEETFYTITAHQEETFPGTVS